MSGPGVRRLAAPGKEGVPKHLVGDASALSDALRLVERPVNAEIDPALAVFLLGLGQRREAARKEWSDDSLVVFGLAVELIRDERERDAIGPVERPQDLEEAAAESSMTGRICGKRGREVGPVEIARRGPER